MRFVIGMMTMVFLLSSPFLLAGDAIWINKIDGLDSDSGLMASTPIKFHFTYQAGPIRVVTFFNPFEISSPDGATWDTLQIFEYPIVHEFFPNAEMDILSSVISSHGMIADTILLWCISFEAVPLGLPPDSANVIYILETKLSDAQIGKTMCLDSTSLQPGRFQWGLVTGQGSVPQWDGPFCFEIVDCCDGIRGDLNGDGNTNILDMVAMINYLFRLGTTPACALESDLNADGAPYNILDLNYFTNYIHRDGPAPAMCP